MIGSLGTVVQDCVVFGQFWRFGRDQGQERGQGREQGEGNRKGSVGVEDADVNGDENRDENGNREEREAEGVNGRRI